MLWETTRMLHLRNKISRKIPIVLDALLVMFEKVVMNLCVGDLR